MVEFYRMSGDVDYLLRVVVPDIAAYDAFYKRLIAKIEIRDVSSSFAMEQIKYTTEMPLDYMVLDKESGVPRGRRGDMMPRNYLRLDSNGFHAKRGTPSEGGAAATSTWPIEIRGIHYLDPVDHEKLRLLTGGLQSARTSF